MSNKKSGKKNHSSVPAAPDEMFTSDYGMTKWHWLVRHRENFRLGKNTEIGNFSVFGCEHGVTIEDGVKVGYHCVVMSESTVDGRKGAVVLKKNCKIGANSVIMPGITVGEGAVVGACSFVNKSVPAREVWAGVPAKKIYSSARKIGKRR